MDSIRFTFLEVLSLIGVVQCVYILVYIVSRAGDFIRVCLPFLYFFVLGAAFLIDFGYGFLAGLIPYYTVLSWATWNFLISVSVLLILQMSHIRTLPPLINWWVLLFVPCAYYFSYLVSVLSDPTCFSGFVCDEGMKWLNISGGVSGALSLLVIWMHRMLFSEVLKQKAGRERYWLILSIIIVNVFFLAVLLFFVADHTFSMSMVLLRTVIGLSFVYLVSTSLFRIYPVALFSSPKSRGGDVLNEGELKLASRMESLLTLEKVYHETSYSRRDLARELDVAESVVSRVINIYFKKTLPQLLNERRVEDAKVLLLDTDVSMKTVAEEVGFNSLPSFNRAFREIVGQSPSDYRKYTIR